MIMSSQCKQISRIFPSLTLINNIHHIVIYQTEKLQLTAKLLRISLFKVIHVTV